MKLSFILFLQLLRGSWSGNTNCASVLKMSENFVIKSKGDYVTVIEKLISKYEINESDCKPFNLDNLTEEVELSALEISMSKALNVLFSQIDKLSKLSEKYIRESFSERSEMEGVAGGGGERAKREVGGGIFPASGSTMDRKSANNGWVTPSQSELVKENRFFKKKFVEIESKCDENEQRGRKGMVISTAPGFKYVERRKVERPSLFEGMKCVDSEGEVTEEDEEHDLKEVLSLIEKKYGIVVPINEVYGCHWLPSGMYAIKFAYRNPTNSAWAKLMKAIKTGGDANLPFYCNVNLTRNRQQLFNAVRSLKYNKRIQQYKVDVNGAISMKFSDKWMRVTQYYAKNGDFIPTRLPNELDQLIG